MPIQSGLIVVGTDTDVGKTYVACQLILQWVQEGLSVGAYKPVASGAASIEQSDAYHLWQATGCRGTLYQVNPQSFVAPLAPPIAAEKEDRTVDDALIIEGARAWSNQCDFLVVEGAGGLHSPISWNMTNAELAMRLGLPLILVAANKLGVVNQVLTTMVAARAMRLDVRCVVLNSLIQNVPDSVEATLDTSIESNERLLTHFLSTMGFAPWVVRLSYGAKYFAPKIGRYLFSNRKRVDG
jgi:dethiobiotin synthetase